MAKVKDWKELEELDSSKYKIELDEKVGAWIVNKITGLNEVFLGSNFFSKCTTLYDELLFDYGFYNIDIVKN